MNQEFLEDNSAINKLDFEVIKDSCIISGTIFGSTIALSTGRTPNPIFVAGECALFFSLMFGLTFLWTHNRALESSWELKNIYEAELKLISDETVKQNEFLKKGIEEAASEFKRLYNKPTFLKYLVRWLKADYLATYFFLSFIIGIFLIWISLLV